jgi:hypothetical protein
LKIVVNEKDIVKVKSGLQWRSMRQHLWLTINPRRGGKMLKPTALATLYVLMPNEFDTFATTIENLQTPSKHVSMMGKYIRKKNFGGLKSHDYHVLM